MRLGSTTLVFMFGGQGSQYYGMGAELFRSNPTFRRWLERGDAALRAATGASLIDTLYRRGRAKSDVFDRLALTHPAIFTVQYALAQCLVESVGPPDLCLGYSLGELAAAATAGVSSFENVLLAVVHQARLVEAQCPPGGMMAVVEDPALFEHEPTLFADCERVARNFEQHFVVAGPPDVLSRVEAALAPRDVLTVRLPVRFAFHSRGLDALESFEDELEIPAGWGRGDLPLVSCATRAVVPEFDGAHIWSALRNPVDFMGTLDALSDSASDPLWVDLSPTGTLATFVKKRAPDRARTRVVAAMSAFGSDERTLARAIDVVRAGASSAPATVVHRQGGAVTPG